MINLIYALLTIMILIPFIWYAVCSASCLVGFVTDGADLRTVFLFQYLFFVTLLILRIIDYFVLKCTDIFTTEFARIYPTIALYLLLNCRLVGYKTMFTNKSFKSLLYALSWVMLVVMICLEMVNLEHFPTMQSIMEVKLDDTMAVLHLSDIISSDRLLAEGINNISVTRAYVAFYIGITIVIMIIDKLEKRKTFIACTLLELAELAVLYLTEYYGNAQTLMWLMNNGWSVSATMVYETALFILYTLIPMALFSIEAESILKNTKKFIEDPRYSMIQQQLNDSRHSQSTKKFKEREKVVVVVIKELKDEGQYFDDICARLTTKKNDDEYLYKLDRLSK